LNSAPTETLLRDWRNGQPHAERLVASLLHIEGFTSVDPQCPLGGPDGTKDIICKRDNLKVVAAVYFPPTHQDFKDVRKKFLADYEGVGKNSASGFAFFVNQRVTPTERTELIEATSVELVEIYHLERILAILDSPRGYGARLEYLRKPMSEEEQFGFWSALRSEVDDRLLTYDSGIRELHEKLNLVLERTSAFGLDLLSVSSTIGIGYGSVSSFPTEQLSISLLIWIHSLLMENTAPPGMQVGKLRGSEVWIGPKESTVETASYIPPPPAKVAELLEKLLLDWRVGYKTISSRAFGERIDKIARFHHQFVSIHPFLDGNGRVARFLLEQQVLELIGRRLAPDFLENPMEYYDYLRAADNGDIVPLVRLISASLQGD
jgi:fido (protein-threonine AMPylation protein)